jgi:3-phenylpropionate/trans-cinnamate dioxygenase ferredoxin reductase component
MIADRTLAIVGASLAGAKAAEGAREAGHDGRIVLIGDENVLPYERPPLSKAVLRGDADPSTTRVQPEDFYATHDIDVVTDTVTELDGGRRIVRLASGESLPFDTAVVATGAQPLALAVPGADLGGVHYLRTLDDALRLQAAIRQAERVAVIGGGWIGSEVAASARQMGADVVLIEPAPTPLHRVLGAPLGQVFAQLHADHGVTLRLGTGVRQLRGTATVHELVLDDGHVEPADLVVAGVGVVPRVDLATDAGLAVDNGVVVDPHLETSASGIYAAGDVANAWHPRYGRHLRVEHWPTPSTRVSRPDAMPRGTTTSISGCRTSSPTSTTWAWSTSGTASRLTRSSCAVTSNAADSSPSGTATAWSLLRCT